MSFALGFSRLLEDIIDEDTKLGNIAEQLGIPNANLGGPGLSTITISGMAGFGRRQWQRQKVNNMLEIAQALSWVHGKHELKFGFNLMSTTIRASSRRRNPSDPTTSMRAYTGYGLADFLYGRPISSQIDITKYFDLNRYRPSIYIQDNWRVTSKLTLNLGLRDEIVTPWKERHNRPGRFRPEQRRQPGAGRHSRIPDGHRHRRPLCQPRAPRRLRL